MIVVDIETSSVDKLKGAILSIGAVDFEKPANQFYGECCMFWGAEINEEALKWNGFRKQDILPGMKQLPEELLQKFYAWTSTIEDRTFAGQQVGSFDLEFLKNYFARAKMDWTFGYRSVDLHSISYDWHRRLGRIPLKGHASAISLDTTLNLVGLPAEQKPHNALTGAKLEAEAFSRLWHGKSLLEEFSQFPVPEYLIPWNEWAERFS